MKLKLQANQRTIYAKSSIVPVEELMRDLPLAVAPEQSKYVGSSRAGASQLACPALNLQMNDGDGLDDLDACEARFNIRCRAIRGDPLKYVLDGATVFDPLAVSGDGGRRVKRGTHEIAVACASACDIAVNGVGNRVMLDEICVGSRLGREKTLGNIR